MATISNTPRPGYVWDSTDNVWYPIGVGGHSHSEIAKTIADAKGDLIVGTAADTVDRLAVGNNGETLVADSSTATGLRWQGLQAAGRNKIINGAFDFWQRGTSSTNNAGYGAADRWYQIKSAGTVTWSRSTDVPTNPYFKYSMSMAGTSIQNPSIVNRMESSDSEVLAGQTVTLSFYAKSTAGSGMTMSWYTQYPGATDDWSSAVDDKNGTVTITTSWARYSVTLLASALATRGYDVYITRASNETSTTLITGVQLELGSVATPFTRAAGTIQGELAACQRYYFETTKAAYRVFSTAQNYSTTRSFGTFTLPVTMRTTPSISLSTATDFSVFNSAGARVDVTALSFSDGNKDNFLYDTTVASGLTAGNATQLTDDGNGAATLKASAEL